MQHSTVLYFLLLPRHDCFLSLTKLVVVKLLLGGVIIGKVKDNFFLQTAVCQKTEHISVPIVTGDLFHSTVGKDQEPSSLL